MTYRDAVLKLDDIRRTMYGVEAETAVNELLDAVDSGEVESDGEGSLDVLRGDIVTFMLSELPYLTGPETGIYEYFSDPASSNESTEADALAMIEAMQGKLRDELAIWEEKTSAEAFEAFNARSGSPGFERGGFPVQQINTIRVQGQAMSMRQWIARKGMELQQAMYSLEDAAAADEKEVSSHEFLRVVQGMVDDVIDEWAGIVAYADNAIAEWQSDYREVFVMVNWKNTKNQVAVGLVFSFISVVVWKTFLGGLLKGTLGFLGKWGDDLARLQARYAGLADDAAKGLVSQGQLDDAWRVLQQHQRLSNANILRYGAPPTGYGELPVIAPRPTPSRVFAPPTVAEATQQSLTGIGPGYNQLPLFPGLWDDAAKIADDAFKPNPLIGMSDDALAELSKGTSIPFNMPDAVIGPAPGGLSIDDMKNPWVGNQYGPRQSGGGSSAAAVLISPTLGASAALNAYLQSVENKMMERSMAIVNEIVGPDLEEQGKELALTEPTTEELTALVEKVIEEHRGEIEVQLESLAEEIMQEEPMPEIPMDSEAGAELLDDAWVSRVESLYSILADVEDLGQFISINDMLNAELSKAVTPEQQAYANGVKAFATDLLAALRMKIDTAESFSGIGVGLPTAAEMEKEEYKNP